MWRSLILDTTTGAVVAPIDVPSLRWTLTVADCSLSTTRDKGTGSADATGLDVPWSAVPARDQAGRAAMLASHRRSMALCWERLDGSLVPVVAGVIGDRTDTWTDTSFDLISPLQFLGSRVLVREGSFGKGQYNADHSKDAQGTSYGQQQGGWRAYLDWTRHEDEDGVSVDVVGGIEVVGQKVDADGMAVTLTCNGHEQKTTTSIHFDGTKKFGVFEDHARMERGATRLSLKSSFKVEHDSDTQTTKSGKPVKETSTASSSASVVTADVYRSHFKGINKNSHAGATEGTIAYANLSQRAIAAAVGKACTDEKPGGHLPIDWTYVGESGRASASFKEFDVGSNDLKTIWESIADADGGPDLQLRPYMPDESHVRLRMVAGSDSEPALGQDSPVRTLTAFPGGGTAQGLKVAHLGPTMRVYATGAGTDEAQLGALAEDLALCKQGYDPWPLVEEVASFSDDDDAGQLADHASARLLASSWPQCQVECTVRLGDPYGIQPGDVWPGQRVDLRVEGFPTLPDATYHLRLMQMEGDQSRDCTLTFDVMDDPWYVRG
ncbi:MAG: hypothetical protein ACI360_08610 [Atopobiaceae bacterium]